MRRKVTKTVRGRKVEDEREPQVRVWLMCFVEASQGEIKVLRRGYDVDFCTAPYPFSPSPTPILIEREGERKKN